MTDTDTTTDDTASTQNDSTDSTGETSDGSRSVLTTALDHVTDIAAIGGLAYVTTTGTPVSDLVVGAFVSIALGKRYITK